MCVVMLIAPRDELYQKALLCLPPLGGLGVNRTNPLGKPVLVAQQAASS